MQILHRTLSFATLGGLLALICTLTWRGVQAQPPLEALAEHALKADPERREKAISSLRSHGYAGIESLVQAAPALAREAHIQLAAGEPFGAQTQSFVDTLDQVCGQRHCLSSGLFWHTNFQAARQEATQRGLPILSLRLLGRLDEDYSCANSRFFRVALYADPQVSERLRQHYVLHWESVRPVPRIQIDFGDGRKLERTLTGNSAHLLLDSSGLLVEALPGLTSPQAFLAWLEATDAEVRALPALGREGMMQTRRAYHQARLEAIRATWRHDQAMAGSEPLLSLETLDQVLDNPTKVRSLREYIQQDGWTSAGLSTLEAVRIEPAMAMALSIGKSAAEGSILTGLQDTPPPVSLTALDALWARLSLIHRGEAGLSSSSLRWIARLRPIDLHALPEATRLALQSTREEVVSERFEKAMLIDALRNEYLLHRRVHQALLEAPLPPVDAFVRWLYAELFRTPDSDAWMGLFDPLAFAALPEGGLTPASSASKDAALR